MMAPMHYKFGVGQFFDPARFSVEIIFTLLILILCFLIYIKTKEFYELSKHKGIYYFRNTFLFFGLAYLFRLAFSLLNIASISLDLYIPRRQTMPLVIMFVGYLSTMAIFYLMRSTSWKRFNDRSFIITANIIAVLIAAGAFIYRSQIILVLLQLLLFIAALLISFKNYSKKKKLSRLFTIYILIFIFWLGNIVHIGPRLRVPLEINIFLDIISISIFAYIYYKVIKWTR